MNINHLIIVTAFIFLHACNGTQPIADKNGDSATRSLTNTYWKLVELNGKSIGEAEVGKRREMFLLLATKDNRVSGNAGCNGFGGTYTLAPGNFRISFSQMMRTQMACDGLDLENLYLSILEKADSYYLMRDTLQLNKRKMAALARFVAVPGKAVTVKQL
jgi:heat shock protein HslJ